MNARVTQADYDWLLRMARRCAFGGAEPEDLVQEATLIALRQGRGLCDRAWLLGVLRRVAYAHYRKTQRRIGRETRAVEEHSEARTPANEAIPSGFVAALPVGLRLVLQLSLSGHTRGEIRHLLGLSDEALRQRLSQLRRRISQAGLSMPEAAPTGGLMFGRIRQALRPVVAQMTDGFGSHDPDGHLFLIGSAHKSRMGGHIQT